MEGMAVPGKSTSAIRLAIRQCLLRCLDSNTPMACLADFTEKLADMGWDVGTIKAVERGVLVMLNARHSDDSLPSQAAS